MFKLTQFQYDNQYAGVVTGCFTFTGYSVYNCIAYNDRKVNYFWIYLNSTQLENISTCLTNKMSGLTAEEIQNAPVLNTPTEERKPIAKSKLDLVLCIVLGISSVFQLIAIYTPGWIIGSTDIFVKVTTYKSVYYFVGCSNWKNSTTCNTGSYADLDLPGLEYSVLVRHQLNIQFSWFAVVGSTVFQVIRYSKVYETFPRLTILNALVLVGTCCTMYQALFEAFASLHYAGRVYDERGFPYSLFLYTIAVIQTVPCTLLVIKQVYDCMQYVQLSLSETKVKFETMEKCYEAEKEGFKRYRQLQPVNRHLRPRSRADDDRSSGNYSPRHSPRPSPRSSPKHSDNRHNARYQELLERSRAKHNNGEHSPDDHFLSPDERSRRPRDHSPRPRDHSPRPGDHSPRPSDHPLRPHDHSPRPRDHSPRPRDHPPNAYDDFSRQGGHSPRPREQSSRQHGHHESERDRSPTPKDPLLRASAPPKDQVDIVQEKDLEPEQEVTAPETIELSERVVNDEELPVAVV